MANNSNVPKNRMTSQRYIVKNFLKENKSHPTADTIYHEVRKKLPQISFGTVYRTLKYLKEMGEIQELDFGPDASRFDGNPEAHFHFHCQNCGQVLDIFPEKAHTCIACLSRFAPGLIKDYRVEAYGICKDCQKMKAVVNKKRSNG